MRDAAKPGAHKLRETCNAQDPARVEALLRSADVFSAEEIAIGRELVEERLRRGAASDYEFRFADHGGDVDGNLGGYCCFGPIPLTQSAWDLYWIAVDPAARGQGIGRVLIDALHDAAANEGCRAIYIDTSSRPDYAPAHRLYAAAGYRVAARLTDFYARGDDKLIFTRAIDTSTAG
ncbi:MAG: GNAT family N-acetyltransferase [Dongiaceae bacterium]